MVWVRGTHSWAVTLGNSFNLGARGWREARGLANYPSCLALIDSYRMVISRRELDESTLGFVPAIRLKRPVLEDVAIKMLCNRLLGCA